MKYRTLLIILLIINSLSINAEVILDGSLGGSGALPGPDYLIGADLGQQHGGNLFHSFQDFNLQSFESATFSGPDSVNNVISRVTGGNPSHIDGLIRSTLLNADMYLLNSYGILFGPNAKLDMPGSFHASTADYLRLGDGGRFDARQPSNSLLTVAPVEAFGFLTDTPAPITIEDSRLSVSEGKTLSLIGGDLDINATQLDYDSDYPEFSLPHLSSPSGRINFASIASRGEVIPTEFGLNLGTETQTGKITAHNSQISVSGEGGGDIFIRAGRFELINSVVESNTLGNNDGGIIDIAVDELKLQGTQNVAGIYTHTAGEGTGGTIHLQVKHLDLSHSGQIASVTIGPGKGGTIVIKQADNLTISDTSDMSKESSGIFSLSYSAETDAGDAGSIDIETHQITLNGGFISNGTLGFGKAGRIDIKAEQILLNEGGQIFNRTLGSGDGGIINLSVTDKIVASGESEEGQSSGIAGQTGDEDITNTGNAAYIDITSGEIILDKGAKIASDTFGLGKGGNILIKVSDTLRITGQDQSGSSSAISTSSLSLEANAGDGGRIEIEADKIILTNGGAVYNATLGPGNGGIIIINVTDTLLATGGFEKLWEESFHPQIRFLSSGIFATTANLDANTGNAGQIYLTARQIKLIDGGQINSDTFGGGKGGSIEIQGVDTLIASGKYVQEELVFYSGVKSSSRNPLPYAGQAGNISVQANSINLTDEGEISTSASNAAGGNVTVNTVNLLYLQDGEITTSVQGGIGNGGNITLSHPVFVILDQGQIKAQADEGRGGNILVSSDQLIRSPDSLVSASSRLGIDGNVEIDAPDINMDDFLVVLPGGFLETSHSLQPSCDTRAIENRSHFVIKKSEGIKNAQGDLLPSGPLLNTTN